MGVGGYAEGQRVVSSHTKQGTRCVVELPHHATPKRGREVLCRHQGQRLAIPEKLQQGQEIGMRRHQHIGWNLLVHIEHVTLPQLKRHSFCLCFFSLVFVKKAYGRVGNGPNRSDLGLVV